MEHAIEKHSMHCTVRMKSKSRYIRFISKKPVKFAFDVHLKYIPLLPLYNATFIKYKSPSEKDQLSYSMLFN